MTATETGPLLEGGNPLVSVIMATYNHGHFIRGALESILQQPYSPIEIIVVDDGSTDNTAEVISVLVGAGAPIHYVRQDNSGQPKAFNHGLRLVRGEVIAFLDADDLWPPDRLPAQMELFDADQKAGTEPVGIVLGRKQYFADRVTVDPKEMAAANGRPYHYALGASLIARRVFDAVGGFDEDMGYVSDWYWFVRARDGGIPMAVDPRVTLLGRIHGGNITGDRALGAHLTVNMVRRHLDRNRAQPGPGGRRNAT